MEKKLIKMIETTAQAFDESYPDDKESVLIANFISKVSNKKKYVQEFAHMHHCDKKGYDEEAKANDPIYQIAKMWHITDEERDAWVKWKKKFDRAKNLQDDLFSKLRALYKL